MEYVTYKIERPGVFVLAPLGDIQFADIPDTLAEEMLLAHIERCESLNATYIGLGDYTDFMSPSNRQRRLSAALYETAEQVIDAAALRVQQKLYDTYLKPTMGKWVGLLSGHHYTQLANGWTTDQVLATMLKTSFLGTCALVELQFEEPRGSVFVWLHHGSGSGRSIASPLTQLEKMAAHWDADLFLMGHHTKLGAAPVDRISMTPEGKLRHRRQYLVATGGWSKAYVLSSFHGRVPCGDYVERAMMTPVALGAPIIYIEPKLVGGEFQATMRVEV